MKKLQKIFGYKMAWTNNKCCSVEKNEWQEKMKKFTKFIGVMLLGVY